MARPRKLPSLESDSPVIIPGANNGIIKIDDDKTKLPVPLRSSIISKLAARRALYQASPLANRPIQIGGGVFPKISCARGDLLFCGIVVSGFLQHILLPRTGLNGYSHPKRRYPKVKRSSLTHH